MVKVKLPLLRTLMAIQLYMYCQSSVLVVLPQFLTCVHQVKTGEDPFTANKENIELNFNTGEEKETEPTETVCPSDEKEFKFARPKCPVGGRKTSAYNIPGRSLSEPSPLVN